MPGKGLTLDSTLPRWLATNTNCLRVHGVGRTLLPEPMTLCRTLGNYSPDVAKHCRLLAFLLLYLDDQLGVEMEVFRTSISHISTWIADNARAVRHVIQIVVRVPVYPHIHLAKQMIQLGCEAG